MKVTVDDVRLYFDVEGCGLAAQGKEMVAKPALVRLRAFLPGHPRESEG
jgi:hypothetical protein